MQMYSRPTINTECHVWSSSPRKIKSVEYMNSTLRCTPDIQITPT